MKFNCIDKVRYECKYALDQLIYLDTDDRRISGNSEATVSSGFLHNTSGNGNTLLIHYSGGDQHNMTDINITSILRKACNSGLLPVIRTLSHYLQVIITSSHLINPSSAGS